MNDELPELTPDETERVRRLLADARHTDPVPADVAARLDRTLATLAEERQSHQVVTLASRRRRRATRLLVAAAAVVVVGIGVGQVVSEMGSEMGSGDADSSADSGTTAESGQDFLDDSPSAATPEAPSAADGDDESAPHERNNAKAATARIDDATFDADVLAARSFPGASVYDSSSPANACDRLEWGVGDRVLVRYAGQRAVLVFRPATGSEQQVDLFTCDSVVPVRSTSVTAP